MIAKSFTSTPHQGRVAAFGSILVIILLVCVGTLATLGVVGVHSRTNVISELANKQVLAWESIERSILHAQLSKSSGEARAKITTLLREHVDRLLSEIEDNEARLKETLSFQSSIASKLLSVQTDKSHFVLTNIPEPVQQAIKKFIRYPDELLEMGLSTWDSQIQIMFRSGAYLEPPRQLALLAQQSARDSLSRTFVAVVALNTLIVAAIVFIWYRIIRPSFYRLEQQQQDQVAINDQLREKNSQFSTAFSALRDATCIVDYSGQILLANPLFEEIFPPSGEVRGGDKLCERLRHLGNPEIHSVFSEDRVFSEVVDELNATDLIYFSGRVLDWKCVPLESGSWFVTACDQTDMLRQREVDIHNERLETLGQISGGVAHDFNNVLGAIMSRTELLKLSSFTQQQIEEQLDTIIDTCERGQALTSQLLTYSRKQSLEPSCISTQQLYEHLGSSLLVPENFRLTFAMVPESGIRGCVAADPHYFVTAVENIVRNSVEAIGDAGGEIRIVFSSTRREDAAMLSVSITDNGEGFSDEALQSALEPFFSTKSELHGTGLGLSMVYGYMEQSGGSVQLKNRAGGGAEVELLLPLIEGVNFPAAEEEQDAGHELAGYTPIPGSSCLLIEDNEQLRNPLRVLLGKLFEEVHAASNKAEAERLVESVQSISAAVCDWKLPDGSSRLVIERLKRTHADCNIVIVSGLVDVEIARFAERQDIKVFSKPLPFERLMCYLQSQGLATT